MALTKKKKIIYDNGRMKTENHKKLEGLGNGKR